MTEKEKPQKFSLKLKEIPVTIVDVSDVEKPYILCELSGKHRDAFFNATRDRFDFTGEKAEIKDFEGIQAELLSKCSKDEKGTLVTVEAIQEYPSSVLSELFNMASDLSALNVKGVEEAKKD